MGRNWLLTFLAKLIIGSSKAWIRGKELSYAKIAIGTYTGTDTTGVSESYQTISVGFTPVAVLVEHNIGYRPAAEAQLPTATQYVPWGGLAVTGSDASIRVPSGGNFGYITIISNGFKVRYAANIGGIRTSRYNYIAFGA